MGPLLRDPVAAVRAEAGARLAEIPAQLLTEAQRKTQAGALEEYVAMRLGSDMPSGPYNLANLETTLGRYAEAEKHYRRAIEIDNQFFLAKTNLALLLNQMGRNTEAETLLREAVAAQPDDAGAAFNLRGLLLAEEGKTAEAEQALRSALKASPPWPLRPTTSRLPIPEPKLAPITTLDARNATPPPRFQVKAPEARRTC